GWKRWAKLNGVLETSCCWIAILLSKSGRKLKRIFRPVNSCSDQTPGSKLSDRFCQGPWNADLRTPPGPEGSNGSLLCIRRGHPGFFQVTNCDLRPVISSGTHRAIVNRISQIVNGMSYQ